MAGGPFPSNDPGPATATATATARPRLSIALVNNMPEAALQATERQFAGLLQEAAGDDFDISLSLYALPGLARGDGGRTAMGGRYAGVDQLIQTGTDALIVTGAEPRAADLRQEPYWADLAGLIDWARTNTVSSLWSCLAAHAAVLHMDGIARQPLPAKCAGVFTFERTGADALTAGLPGLIRIPHSRHNGLSATELEAKGYRILCRSPSAGVDSFTRQGQSLFVFLQGHPEYDGESLMREYCRDVGRYLRGEQAHYPQSPHGYFDAGTERSFRALAVRARSSREAQLLNWSSEIAAAFKPARPWRAHAVGLYRNWLRLIATGKGDTASAASAGKRQQA
jgi:homoserine O-succinyltransferase